MKMAERRMIAKTIVDSDAFLDMPHSTQLLYFHLSMRADDDGFINNPKKIQRMIGAADDDLKMLIAKNMVSASRRLVVIPRSQRRELNGLLLSSLRLVLTSLARKSELARWKIILLMLLLWKQRLRLRRRIFLKRHINSILPSSVMVNTPVSKTGCPLKAMI